MWSVLSLLCLLSANMFSCQLEWVCVWRLSLVNRRWLSQGHTCAGAHAAAVFTEPFLFQNPTSVHMWSRRPGNKASAMLNLWRMCAKNFNIVEICARGAVCSPCNCNLFLFHPFMCNKVLFELAARELSSWLIQTETWGATCRKSYKMLLKQTKNNFEAEESFSCETSFH